MAIISENLVNLLHNNGMLSVHIRIATMRRFLMSTHNIKFQNKKKNSQNIYFLELSEEFRWDSKTSSN